MNQLPRRALSRYGLTFQGNILSVNCQCRILIRVRRTTTRSPVLVSISNPEPKWRIKWQNLQSGSNFAIPVPLITISFMGFSRTITTSLGNTYRLPNAEYIYSSKNEDKESVADLAESVASKVKKNPGVLVTESNGRYVKNLDDA